MFAQRGEVMDVQKQDDLIKEAFEIEAEEIGFCLDQLWGDYENPYENSDTALAFNLFKKGWLAKAQAVPEGFVLLPIKDAKFFSHDGDNYEVHDTLVEAKYEAECAIEHYRERLADQLSDPRSDGNFQDVGYGVVLAKSGYSIDHVVTQADIDKGDYSYEVGTEILSLFLIEAQEPTND